MIHVEDLRLYSELLQFGCSNSQTHFKPNTFIHKQNNRVYLQAIRDTLYSIRL
jgi:hypothetical protein